MSLNTIDKSKQPLIEDPKDREVRPLADHPADREGKPRKRGLTMVIDKGLGIRQTTDMLEVAHEYVDWIKLAFGTSLLYPEALLKQKIDLIRSFGVGVYPGGTLTEIVAATDDAERWISQLPERGFNAVEISEGTIDFSPKQRRTLIEAGKRSGLFVFTEVGKKDPNHVFHPEKAGHRALDDAAAGADVVIIEGRDSGKNISMYDDSGRPIPEVIGRLTEIVSDRVPLMWEAPLPSQHVYWVKQVGPHVNLGNVQFGDVMSLEAVRQGLRGDTVKDRLNRIQRSTSR